MQQNVAFIRDPKGGDEQQAMSSFSSATTAKNIAFELPSMAVRQRVGSVVRKGLVEEAKVREIVAKTDEIGAAAVDSLLVELVNDKDDRLPARYLRRGCKQLDATCKIVTEGIDYLGRRGSWSGTGFLVSPNILLTNHHVLNSIQVAQKALVIFNYEEEETSKLLPVTEFTLDPGRLYLTSPVVMDDNGSRQKGLDYTFVWVNDAPGDTFGFVSLKRSSFDIVVGESANIIQHPNGDPKVVALHNNLVIRQDLVVVHYSSDTDPGSSGSLVANNEWKPLALHHASMKNPKWGQDKEPEFLNEGIKLSAIAAHVEQRSRHPEWASQASQVLPLFKDIDTTLGFFGSLGRNIDPGLVGVEKVVTTYRGESDDVDVGFWNIEWFNKFFEKKLDKVADMMAEMNLDVWALSEASLEATQELCQLLKKKYKLDYGCEGAEPEADSSKQTNTVLFNKKTVKCKKIDWPEEVKDWFLADSRHFDSLDLNLEAVHGKIFPRVAQPYLIESANRTADQTPFAFNLLALHLKAMDEGATRRRMASRILAAAINRMRKNEQYDKDWVIGGDLNAEISTGDFTALLSDMEPISASDEKEGAISYLKKPKSLIDHIYLTKGMLTKFDKDQYFIVAAEKEMPGYIKEVSDHRPVLVRLSLLQSEKRIAGLATEHLKELQTLLQQAFKTPAKEAAAETLLHFDPTNLHK